LKISPTQNVVETMLLCHGYVRPDGGVLVPLALGEALVPLALGEVLVLLALDEDGVGLRVGVLVLVRATSSTEALCTGSAPGGGATPEGATPSELWTAEQADTAIEVAKSTPLSFHTFRIWSSQNERRFAPLLARNPLRQTGSASLLSATLTWAYGDPVRLRRPSHDG
jgi:hypothetical protein